MSAKTPPEGPSRAVPGRPPMDPEQAKTWFRATFGEMPAPTAHMDAPCDDRRDRRREALAALERSLPEAYKWAKFSAPELPERVGSTLRRVLDHASWREPRVVLMGNASSGKTSVAVACLRRWVAESLRPAGFFHAYALGVARIQHAAGRGEPEIVDHAMKCPRVLLDDLGSERDTAGNAVPDVILLRHAENRPLWVTTGLTRPQLVTRYGEGVVWRLFERAVVIQMGSTTK